MKCTIPEIAWHNKDPVLSVDIQPVEKDYYRLASGGTDCHILIWHMKVAENENIDLEVVADLTRHQRAVNVVRWSPSGQYLASADDDANIIIWKMKVDNTPLLDECTDKEIWIGHKVLRGHKEDVYDLCWSPDDSKIISGSIDNTAIIWDTKQGKMDHIISDHKGFVQGVCWDPKDEYVATLSSDRTCRIFNNLGKQVLRRIRKGLLPLPSAHALHNKEVKYFHDDTFKSYFRRITFSPDGNLLIAPSGCIETDDCKRFLNVTYIFAVEEAKIPIAVLPTSKQDTIAARCCPVLFELRPNGPDPLVPLPYRIVIAIATDSDVILYDTQQLSPFAHLQKVHYTRLTDLTWSSDGLVLICSSTDGFCTIVTFTPNELGVPYRVVEIQKENVVENNVKENQQEISTEETVVVNDIKPKKPNLLEQWTIKSPKGAVRNITKPAVISHKQKTNEKAQNIVATEIIELTDSPEKKTTIETSAVKTTKRIAPIKIGACTTPKRQKSELLQETAQEKVSSKEILKDVNTNEKIPKQNSILNFVKKAKKSSKKKELFPVDNSNVGVELETEARDAWKCTDNSAPSELIKKDECSDTTDDIPVDFKLEITNSSVSNVLQETTTTEFKTDGAKLEESEAKKMNSDKDVTEKINKIPDAEVKPKGRRVPLITISGPKKKA